MGRSLVVGVTLLVTTAAPAHADCAADAARLRRHLTDEARRADTWNTAWALGFGAATVGQLGAVDVELNPLGTYDDAFESTLYVGALKAGLGTASRLVLPLKIPVPEALADPCDDARALRRAVAKAAKIEQRSFWLTIIGGTALNLAGAIYLTAKHDFKTGALSFATSLPVAPFTALTQPRNSLKLYRRSRVEWSVGVGAVGASF
jgi:hypothetical protein